MKKIYVLLMFFLPLNVFACRQMTDILIWKGDRFGLHSEPLSLHSEYDSLWMQITEILWSVEGGVSTICGQGYIAEWVILNDSIFLYEIHSCEIDFKINLKDIFPEIGDNERLFASWVNGELYVPQGKEIADFGRKGLFEYETVLNVENGVIKNYETFHNRIVKISDFPVREFIYKNINWNILPEIPNYITVSVGVQPNEQGQFESITDTWITEHPVSNNSLFFDPDTNNVFVKEVIKVVKLIPEWTVIYQRGKILPQGTPFGINFSEAIRKRYAQQTNKK